MDKSFYQKVFSAGRIQKYLDYHNQDNQALLHYNSNIKLSQSFYPLLPIFEVALRNSMNRELISLYGTEDWYLRISSAIGLKDLNKKILLAQKLISKRNEVVSADKVVAELTFGFWTESLNAEYEQILWKDLKRAFPYLEKQRRQRKKVSAPINHIRLFRNRVYHNEPILWNTQYLFAIHSTIIETMSWLNKGLPEFVKEFDNFENVFNETKSTFIK